MAAEKDGRMRSSSSCRDSMSHDDSIDENLTSRRSEPANFAQVSHFQQDDWRDRKGIVLQNLYNRTRKTVNFSLKEPNNHMRIEVNHDKIFSPFQLDDQSR